MANNIERLTIGVRTEAYTESFCFYDKTIGEAIRECYEKDMFKHPRKKGTVLRMCISAVIDGVEMVADKYIWDQKLLGNLLVEGALHTRVLMVLSTLRFVADHPEMELEDYETVVRARDILKAMA